MVGGPAWSGSIRRGFGDIVVGAIKRDVPCGLFSLELRAVPRVPHAVHSHVFFEHVGPVEALKGLRLQLNPYRTDVELYFLIVEEVTVPVRVP